MASKSSQKQVAQPAAQVSPKSTSKKLSKPTSKQTPKPAAKAKPSASPQAATPKAVPKPISKPTSKPHSALQAPIRVFQIYYEPWHRDLLDPAFVPLDNAGATSELLEFSVFERLQAHEATQGAQLWGALSWRFGEKTGMKGAELLDAIAANPGHDVYFCNPHIHNEALYHNMWMQGETAHPHFVALTRAVFRAAGLDEAEIGALHPSSSYSSANYFVGSPKFWALYVPFIRRVLKAADENLTPPLRNALHSTAADPRGLHGGATYVPFIVERLFGYFMRTEGKALTAHKLPLLAREAELNVHQKLLRDMKDVAHSTKSAWLAACWVNYRNLYLNQMNSEAWCAQYLRQITPTDVRFV
jgi:hypothetical protein